MNIIHSTLQTPDGFTLDYVYTDAGKPLVIFCHGMTVNKDDENPIFRAEPLLHKLGISTIRFDFRAHGKSSGNSIADFTITGELKDLEAIVERAASGGHTILGIAGASFGGAIAALYAGYNPHKVKSLVLINPALDLIGCFLEPVTPWGKEMFDGWKRLMQSDEFLEVGSQKFKVGKKLFLDLQDYQPDLVLNDYKGPICIVQGDQDDKVDPEKINDIFVSLDSEDKEIEVIHGAHHGFHDEPFATEVGEMIARFFERTLL